MKRIIGIILWLLAGSMNILSAQSISAVKNTLYETANTLSLLSGSAKINKWSKYKPVPGSWPAASNGKYSIDPFNNWTYTKPYNNFRLGDFRNYNPNAKPPVYMDENGSYEEADLYPLNTPDHSDWNFIVNTNPASGELSYGDLGLSNYYVGFKVITPGGTVYYKSYDAIPTFNSKVITISAALNSHVLPYSYANLPYGVGNFIMEFGFCTGQTNGWSTSNPGFHLLPDVTPTINCINSYSFEVHPWIYLTKTGMGFSGSGYTYQSSHISTSLSNWKVISKPTWIDLSVYQNGSSVGNSALWATEMDIHIVPNSDNTSGSTRNGTVVLGTDNSALASIGLSQESASLQLPEAFVLNIGFNMSSSNANISLGSTSLTYSLTTTNAGSFTLATAELLKNGVSIDSQSIQLRDFKVTSGSFTLSQPANYNDEYIVRITIDGGLI